MLPAPGSYQEVSLGAWGAYLPRHAQSFSTAAYVSTWPVQASLPQLAACGAVTQPTAIAAAPLGVLLPSADVAGWDGRHYSVPVLRVAAKAIAALPAQLPASHHPHPPAAPAPPQEISPPVTKVGPGGPSQPDLPWTTSDDLYHAGPDDLPPRSSSKVQFLPGYVSEVQRIPAEEEETVTNDPGTPHGSQGSPSEARGTPFSISPCSTSPGVMSPRTPTRARNLEASYDSPPNSLPSPGLGLPSPTPVLPPAESSPKPGPPTDDRPPQSPETRGRGGGGPSPGREEAGDGWFEIQIRGIDLQKLAAANARQKKRKKRGELGSLGRGAGRLIRDEQSSDAASSPKPRGTPLKPRLSPKGPALPPKAKAAGAVRGAKPDRKPSPAKDDPAPAPAPSPSPAPGPGPRPPPRAVALTHLQPAQRAADAYGGDSLEVSRTTFNDSAEWSWTLSPSSDTSQWASWAEYGYADNSTSYAGNSSSWPGVPEPGSDAMSEYIRRLQWENDSLRDTVGRLSEQLPRLQERLRQEEKRLTQPSRIPLPPGVAGDAAGGGGGSAARPRSSSATLLRAARARKEGRTLAQQRSVPNSPSHSLQQQQQQQLQQARQLRDGGSPTTRRAVTMVARIRCLKGEDPPTAPAVQHSKKSLVLVHPTTGDRLEQAFDAVFPMPPTRGDGGSVSDGLGRQVVKELLEGHDVCILSFGVHSRLNLLGGDDLEHLVAMVCQAYLSQGHPQPIQISGIEVHGDRLNDLLLPRNQWPRGPPRDTVHPIWLPCPTVAEVLAAMDASYRQRSGGRRPAGMEGGNARSHALFTLWFGLAEGREAYLTVCQAAARDKADSREEDTLLARSLASLARVVKCVAEGRPPVFRSCRLTAALQKSLQGDNLHVVAVTTFSPSPADYSEALEHFHLCDSMRPSPLALARPRPARPPPEPDAPRRRTAGPTAPPGPGGPPGAGRPRPPPVAPDASDAVTGW